MIDDSHSHSKLVHRRRTTNSGSTTYSEECAHLNDPLKSAALSPLKGSVACPVALQAINASVGLSEAKSSDVNGERLLALTNRQDGAATSKMASTSITTQTVPKENAVFSIARCSSSSSDSAMVSSDETEEKREPEDDQTLRSLEECLTIFKSDVSAMLPYSTNFSR